MSVDFYGDDTAVKNEVNLATLYFGDITIFKTVVSVCLLVQQLSLKIIGIEIYLYNGNRPRHFGLIMGRRAPNRPSGCGVHAPLPS